VQNLEYDPAALAYFELVLKAANKLDFSGLTQETRQRNASKISLSIEMHLKSWLACLKPTYGAP
jgi:hypothetical protein